MHSSGDPGPARLLRMARDGQQEAIAEILAEYRSYVSLCCRLQIDRRLQGKADPSDLVQETFLEAQRSFAQFRGTTEGELVRWLGRILASRLAKLVRRYYGAKRRDVRLERELEDDLDRSTEKAQSLSLAFSGTSPSESAIRREQSVLLAETMAELPDDYREVIILRHFEELTFPEVAQRMGRSEEAVKKTWARALAALRRAFGARANGTA